MRLFLITIFIFPIILFAQSEQKKSFTRTNSPIPEDNITTIATDINGLNWIGTLEGLICYNGKRWVTLNTKNSKLPSNKILCIETTNNANYIGTTEGLVIIKNNNWEIYTIENSALPSNKIRKIVKDYNGNIWLATERGLAKYDGKNWTVFSKKTKNY